VYIAVKKLRKSVNICLSYRQNKSVSFFMAHSVYPTVFEILTFKGGKWFASPLLPCFTPLLWKNPLESLDENYSANTRWMGLSYDENCIIILSTVFDWSTRVTDGRVIACCRALKITRHLRLPDEHELVRQESRKTLQRGRCPAWYFPPKFEGRAPMGCVRS